MLVVLVMMMAVMVVMAMLVMMLVFSVPLTVRQLHRSLQSRLQCRDVDLGGLVDHVVVGVQVRRGSHRALLCRGCLRGQRHHRCRLVFVVIMIIVVVFWCVVIKTRAEDVVGLEVPEANITVTACTWYIKVEKSNQVDRIVNTSIDLRRAESTSLQQKKTKPKRVITYDNLRLWQHD